MHNRASGTSAARWEFCGLPLWSLLIGIIGRFFVYSYFHETLQTRFELVAHHTSFLQVKEAVFLEDQLKQNPYLQGDYHQSPLILIISAAIEVR